jgi:hypothetical protein
LKKTNANGNLEQRVFIYNWERGYIMKKYRIASILMIIHGGFMEIGGCLAIVLLLAMGSDKIEMSNHFSFIVPYLQENLNLMLIMAGIYGCVSKLYPR